MRTLIATKGLRYATRRLLPGDEFSANNRDARILMAIGKARDPREPGTLPAPPAKLVAKVRGGSKRAVNDGTDMAALRKNYLEIVGKKAFGGWDAAELRRRIDVAQGH